METYLLMIYVTLEQEAAIARLYAGKGWQLNKKNLTDVESYAESGNKGFKGESQSKEVTDSSDVSKTDIKTEQCHSLNVEAGLTTSDLNKVSIEGSNLDTDQQKTLSEITKVANVSKDSKECFGNWLDKNDKESGSKLQENNTRNFGSCENGKHRTKTHILTANDDNSNVRYETNNTVHENITDQECKNGRMVMPKQKNVKDTKRKCRTETEVVCGKQKRNKTVDKKVNCKKKYLNKTQTITNIDDENEANGQFVTKKDQMENQKQEKTVEVQNVIPTVEKTNNKQKIEVQKQQPSYKNRIAKRKKQNCGNRSTNLGKRSENTLICKNKMKNINEMEAGIERKLDSSGDLDKVKTDKEKEINGKINSKDPAIVSTIINKLLKVERRENVNKEQESLTCPHCDRIFLNRLPFIKHVEKHSKNEFDCPECGRRFKNHRNLNAHRFNRSKETVFTCDICNFEASTACLLRTHKKNKHPPEVWFQCHLCPKQIKTKSYLNVHLKECHNIDDGHLECKICGKRLHRPKLFAKHMKEHEENGNFLERNCPKCGKTFKSKLHLRSHMRIHRERTFLCDHCGKGFVTKTKLSAHERTHSGYKPFECMICQYKSTQNGNLRLHMKVHEKEEERKLRGEPVRNRKNYEKHAKKPEEIIKNEHVLQGDSKAEEDSYMEDVKESSGSSDNSECNSVTTDSRKMMDYYKYLCDPQVAHSLMRAGYSESDIRESFMEADYVRVQHRVHEHTQTGFEMNKPTHKNVEQLIYPELKIPDPSKQTQVVHEAVNSDILHVNVPSSSDVDDLSKSPSVIAVVPTISTVNTDSIATYTESNQNAFADVSTIEPVFTEHNHKTISVPKPNLPHVTINVYPDQNRTVFSDSHIVQYSNQVPPSYSHHAVYGNSLRVVYAEDEAPVYSEALGSIDYSETIQSVYDSSRLLYARTNKQDINGANWKNQSAGNGDSSETSGLEILEQVKNEQLKLDKSLFSEPKQAASFQPLVPVTQTAGLTFLEQTRPVYPSSSQTPSYTHYAPSMPSVTYSDSERSPLLETRTMEQNTYSAPVYHEADGPSNTITNAMQFSNVSAESGTVDSYHGSMATKVDFANASNMEFIGTKTLQDMFVNSGGPGLQYTEQGNSVEFHDQRHQAYTDLQRATFTTVHQHEEMQ